MGITKQYLKYVPGGQVNLIADSNCNVIFVTLEGQEGRFVAVGACEHVYVWDLRLGEKVQVLSGNEANVTYLAASPNKRHIAAGYDDGSIKIFDLRSAENVSIFVGHRSEVTCLAYDHLGHRLVSGSKDTDIIVWDVVAETGICRLVGHKNMITQVAFMKDHSIIISSSKDHLIKFWDIENEFNFKTLTGHNSEIWSFALVKDDQYLITGCNDPELYVWKISFADTLQKNEKVDIPTFILEDEDDNDMKYPLHCAKIGNIVRAGKGRVCSLVADYSGQVVGCHGTDNKIELFHFLSEKHINSKKTKRVNKLKKKASNDENLKEKLQEIELDTVLRDQINRLQIIKAIDKVKSLDLIMGKGNELRVSSILSNNTIDLCSVIVTDKTEFSLLRTLSSHGHRTEVRAICFSSDSLAFATASGDSVKLWNRPSLQCIRTVKCGYASSIIFAPGDRYLIVGLKDGKILIIDIAASEIQEEIAAHESSLNSLSLWPKQDNIIGIVSGGDDKAVKFWLFDDVKSAEKESQIVTVIHKKTLNFKDAVNCVKISPNGRFLASALMDFTVKICFVENFKPFTTLYGHKLPIKCLDISSDSTLLVTGSEDRNVKIWGLDYGDCHKSLFAHDDSVTGINFVPKTHYFFTCGKDGKVKEWDADIFQKIVTLRGHAGQAFNCAISPNGCFLTSCGSDKVVHIFEKSSEILVLEDEAEEERAKQDEIVTGEITAVQGQKSQILPSRKTVNSEKAAELLLECLDVCRAYAAECASVVPPSPSPPLPLLMQVYKCKTTEEFLLENLKRIRASDFDEALLLLPYSSVCEIIKMLPNLLKSPYQAEMIAKLTLSLIHAHHGPIVASQDLLPQVEEIKSLALEQISTLRGIFGFNMYGMAYMQRVIEESEGIKLFKEAQKSQKKKNVKRKNKETALKRAIMTL